jgi:DNA polymerase III gamma/tau subunit
MSFNASVEVTEVVMRTLENASKELAKRCILECALRHNFDGDEELRILGLDNVTVIRKKSEKKPIIKQKPVITDKPKFCLPFLAISVDENGCNGIAFNEGLFTQCKKVRVDNETFCKMCLGESLASENGEPKNGTVQRRSNSPYYSYEDSRGRMPPSYQDYMKKKGITEDEVLSEAEKQGLTIPREHFASFTRSKKREVKVVKKSKKSLILEEDGEKEDLFGNLTDLLEETLDELSDDVPVLDDYEKAKKEEEKKAEKEAKALQKAAEKAQQKVERETKLAEEKAEREAKLALEKAEKAAEREAKKAQEKAAREAKLEQEKVEREAKVAQKALEKAEREAKAEQEKAEKAAKLAQDKADAKAARETKQAEEKATREAKVAQDKADREAKKAQEKEAKKPTQKAQKTVEKPVEKVVEKPVEPTAPKKVTVKRLFYNGKQYLKSGENVLYDPVTKEEVGIWCEETQTILDLPDEYYEDEDDENDEN